VEREAWRPFLARWSGEWLVVDEERRPAFDDEVVRSRWLGFPPAAPEDVAAAEARLGCTLPPSLRDFLLVTNGWRQTNGFIDELAGTSELAWLRDTSDAHWIEAYGSNVDDVETGALLARSLRVSLSGDATVVFLDPEDRDAGGEWAAYELASWSGVGPECAGSFRALMERQYASFHALFKPPGATRDHWDARVDDARLLALAGGTDEAWAILEEAAGMGRERADLLLGQMATMQGRWYGKSLGNTVLSPDLRARLLDDPVLLDQVLAVLFVEHRFSHGDGNVSIDFLRQYAPGPLVDAVDVYERRRERPDFRLGFGDPDFDAAVDAVIDRLVADPAVHPPNRDPEPSERGWEWDDDRVGHDRAVDAVWPDLLAAVGRWRPASDDLIVPIALLADPVIGPLITPERGRQILSVPRGASPS
jgi:hypothetical protein